MNKILEKSNTTPSTDPQDGGFDTFLSYVATRDPTISEPLLPYHNYPWLPFWWQNATSTDSFSTYITNSYWLCVDNTADVMIWWKMVFDANILAVLSTQGWQLNTARSYTPRSSPAFSAEYTPSATNDTYVTATLSLTSTLLVNATVELQVNSGSGYSTVDVAAVPNISATLPQCLKGIVPAGASYQLVQSSGSDSTIVSINELTQ